MRKLTINLENFNIFCLFLGRFEDKDGKEDYTAILKYREQISLSHKTFCYEVIVEDKLSKTLVEKRLDTYFLMKESPNGVNCLAP